MPMYWGYGSGWAGFFWMVVWMAVWLGLFSLALWAVLRASSRRQRPTLHHEWHIRPAEPSALEILNRRYARGDLDAATYEAMRERIQAPSNNHKSELIANHR